MKTSLALLALALSSCAAHPAFAQTTTALPDGSVTTRAIADGAITASKLAPMHYLGADSLQAKYGRKLPKTLFAGPSPASTMAPRP
jgi:hypothetical protein